MAGSLILLPAMVSFSGADFYSCMSFRPDFLPYSLKFQQQVRRKKCENANANVNQQVATKG